VIFEDKVAIVRHLFKATETNKEGKVTPVNFSMLLVWVKENGVQWHGGSEANINLK
jgi:hypothetical protein